MNIINGIDINNMDVMTDERLMKLLITADGKGMIVKKEALTILKDRAYAKVYHEE